MLGCEDGWAKGGKKETHPFTPLNILDHVLVRLVLRVHSRLRALDGESEGVDHNERVPDYLALHDAHDLIWDTRAGMDGLGRCYMSIRPSVAQGGRSNC